MDTHELLKAIGVGVTAAFFYTVFYYGPAAWQWLKTRKASPAVAPSETDSIAQEYEALRYLESRPNKPPGYRRGCAAIRKAFLPPLTEDAVEG